MVTTKTWRHEGWGRGLQLGLVSEYGLGLRFMLGLDLVRVQCQ